VDDELITIGRFARLSGLSVATLRHYDDVDLLAPADVDPASGYRRYRRDQVGAARLIRSLRWVDLPIDEIRQILAGTDAHELLARHRRRLEREQGHLAAKLRDVDRFLVERFLPDRSVQEGLSMKAASTTTTQAVQIKIAVDDVPASVEFYGTAFGLRYDVIRRTDDEDISGFVIGEYDQPGFFLLVLLDDNGFIDRPGRSTFGLLVDDIDAAHSRALVAGGTEAVAPHDPQGLPRCSAITDPSGNWVWLYQG